LCEEGGITLLVKVLVAYNSVSEADRQVKGEVVIGGKKLFFVVELLSSIGECIGDGDHIERTRELAPISIYRVEESILLSNREYEILFCSIGIMAFTIYDMCTVYGIPFEPSVVKTALSIESEFCRKLSKLGCQFLDETVGDSSPN